MDKPIAAFLQAGAAYMFWAAGAFSGDAVLLIAPAVASGVAGLMLWARGTKATLPPRQETPMLESQVAQVQESLASLQDDISRLREDREFFQKLYSGTPEDPQALVQDHSAGRA